MRNFYGFTLIILVASCHGGLVQRRYRDVGQQPDQIPVQVIELAEGEDLNPPFALPVTQKKDAPIGVALETAEPVSNEILKQKADILKPEAVAETVQIAEDIAEAFEKQQKIEAIDVLVEAARKKDEQLVQQESAEAVKEENQQLLRAVAALEQAVEPKKEIKESAPEAENEKLSEISVPVAIVEEKPLQSEDQSSVQQIKLVPLDTEEPIVAVVTIEENVKQPEAIEVATGNLGEAVPNLRQSVTQPTPIQTSTQQNFLQQLIQPVGQFISQFTGGQQQQQAQAAAVPDAGAAAPAAPAAPLPTLPGFLNPSAAITSAQQAVQNVVNSTSQAFQGLQQFASNLGSTVQNTLSGLGGQQQQLSTADVTTTRPPGPFQAIISNFIGGSQQQQAAAEPLPGTGGGPLQGIISFFQGGNRPTVAAIVSSTAEPVKLNLPTSAPGVDDKIDDAAAQEEAVAQDEYAAAAAVLSNEVRASAEIIEDAVEDSFEESQPEELIVVNDDAATESNPDLQSTN